MLRRVQLAWWSLVRIKIFWSAAAAVAGVAGLYGLDSSGADAAELLRYPLQLNVAATLAALVAVAVAAPGERLMRRWGWHPMTGARRLWMLVLATPLVLAGASIVLGLLSPVMNSSAQIAARDHSVIHEARSLVQLLTCAHWVVAAGAVWMGWVAYVTMTVVSRRRSARRLVREIRQDPRTMVISAHSDSEPVDDPLTASATATVGCNLVRSDIRALYCDCLARLGIAPANAPALVVSAHPRVSHFGPFYAACPGHGAVIVLPADLNEYFAETFRQAKDHVRANSAVEERVVFSQRKWALAGLATLLLHELVHHTAQEGRLDRFVELTKALFPVPWVTALWFAARKLNDAREHTCDAVVAEKTDIEAWFIRIAVGAMHNVLDRIREARIRHVLASMRLLSAEFMAAGDAGAIQRRMALLDEMPSHLRPAPAAILLSAVCGLALLFAPRPMWNTIVSFPDVVPFSRGVPHVRIHELETHYDIGSLQALIQSPMADWTHVEIPEFEVPAVTVPPAPVFDPESIPIIVPEIEIPTVTVPVIEVPTVDVPAEVSVLPPAVPETQPLQETAP